MGEQFLTPGEILQKRYKIENLVSSTGMGQIYKAADLRFPGKWWAVKAFKEIEPEYFKNQAKRWASFNHPHLIKIADFLQTKENQILIMEYIGGMSLNQILENAGVALPERQILSWGIQCSDILLYLQENFKEGFHYCCFSPKKILITLSGKVKMIPIPELSANSSSPAGIIGFSPPEIFSDIPAFNETTELYTLASILYLCLAGEGFKSLPFVFPPLNSVHPNLVSSIDKVLEKATQPIPEKRYSNLRVFRNELYKCFLEINRKRKLLPETQDKTAVLWKLTMALSALSSLLLLLSLLRGLG
jgi:serine/threonine-protein kinase